MKTIKFKNSFYKKMEGIHYEIQIFNFFILVPFLILWTFSGYAQTPILNGKEKLIEFTNANSNFTVPNGKSWIIYSIFSDYLIEGKVVFDKTLNKRSLENTKEVRIF